MTEYLYLTNMLPELPQGGTGWPYWLKIGKARDVVPRLRHFRSTHPSAYHIAYFPVPDDRGKSDWEVRGYESECRDFVCSMPGVRRSATEPARETMLVEAAWFSTFVERFKFFASNHERYERLRQAWVRMQRCEPDTPDDLWAVQQPEFTWMFREWNKKWIADPLRARRYLRLVSREPQPYHLAALTASRNFSHNRTVCGLSYGRTVTWRIERTRDHPAVICAACLEADQKGA